MYFLLVSVASLATCSHTACTVQIPGYFQLFDHSGFLSFHYAFTHDTGTAWKTPTTRSSSLEACRLFSYELSEDILYSDSYDRVCVCKT